jgi:hypothetical protein
MPSVQKLSFHGCRVLVGNEEKVLKMGSGDAL